MTVVSGTPSTAIAPARRCAFIVLRRYARGHNYPLTQLAGDVIRGTAVIAGIADSADRPSADRPSADRPSADRGTPGR